MTIATAPKYTSFIQRRNGSNSQQPRFNEVKPSQFFTSLFRFFNTDIQNEPSHSVNSRERDVWLSKVWKLEPYMAGVINSVTSIDKNRGWTITGGRNQVRRFSKMLHERFFYAPDLSGWRMSFGGSALSYYTSDLGSVTEIGRDGQNGPVDSLYFTDPARCTLTGRFDFPLKYDPTDGNEQPWAREDYFRIASLPDTAEQLYGLGYCALSRCIELLKIMVGIYQYDNEMLLNKAPRGLLLLKGITQEQWEEAMTARTAKLEGDEKRYYGAVNVLAQVDPGVELEAQLTALSSLPAEFNQQIFTDLLMFGYALIFGYDPREFWPVTGGQLGTATETEAQHRKAGAKGGLDFTLGYAEKLQEEFPDTVQFEFEERDLDGELANAEVEQAQADVVTGIYESGLREGSSLVSRNEARIMLADRGLIDTAWTENEEEAIATDTEDAESKAEAEPVETDMEDTRRRIDKALTSERVQRAIWQYPDEPIVQYRFSVENGREKHEYRTLLKPTQIKRRFYSFGQMVRRQVGEFDDELGDYQEQINELSRQANEGEISADEFQTQLDALTIAVLVLALARGSGEDNEAQGILTGAAMAILSGENVVDNLAILTDQALLEEAFPEDALGFLVEDIDGSLQSTLTADIFNGRYTDNAQSLLSRLTMWGTTARGLFNFGQMIANPNQLFQWRRDPLKDSCTDCFRLNGQVHTGAEWRASGWRPQGMNLNCTGRHCGCGVFPVELPAAGSF
jgi:hypothetical protein